MAWEEAFGLYNGIKISKLKNPSHTTWGCSKVVWTDP
jgi:hypothetical protein